MALSFKLAKNYLLKQTKIKSNNNNLIRQKYGGRTEKSERARKRDRKKQKSAK